MRKKFIIAIIALGMFSLVVAKLTVFDMHIVDAKGNNDSLGVQLEIAKEDGQIFRDTETFRNMNISQPWLECYVEGDFSWTAGENVVCNAARGGVAKMPEGWTLVEEELKIHHSIIGWKHGATYSCTLKTVGGVERSYEVTIAMSKEGEVFA